MSTPEPKAEMFEMSESFWDALSTEQREAMLVKVGYAIAPALNLGAITFTRLSTEAKRAVVREIGEILMEKHA